LDELEHGQVARVTALLGIGRQANDLCKHALLGAVGFARAVESVGENLGMPPALVERTERGSSPASPESFVKPNKGT
jgi:hypothetical protein